MPDIREHRGHETSQGIQRPLQERLSNIIFENDRGKIYRSNLVVQAPLKPELRQQLMSPTSTCRAVVLVAHELRSMAGTI